MILLDTDHWTVLQFPDAPRAAALRDRMRRSGELVATSAVTLEEQLRGWLAEISRLRNVADQVHAYASLVRAVEVFLDWEIIPFDTLAAEQFQQLRRQRIRIGTQDLKIASIALVNDALLLSANLRDFNRVPSLRVESWLD